MTKLAEYLHSLELITLQKNNHDSVYAFKHIFAQELVYNSLFLSDRQQLHQQAGEVLEDLYFGRSATDTQEFDETTLLLAHHFEQGDDRLRALKYLKQAATQAKSSYANQEAISLYDRILELLEDRDFHGQWDILAELEQVLDRLGWREQQTENLDGMQSLAELLGDNLRLAISHNRWAMQLDKISDYQAAAESAKKGLEFAHRAGDERLEAQSLNLLAWAAWRRFEYHEVKNYAEQALNVLHVTGDPLNRMNSLLHLGKASYRLGQYDAAIEYTQAVQDWAQLIDSPDSEAEACLILGWIYQQLGDYVEAEQQYQATLEKRRFTGDRYGEATALSHLGWVAHDREDYDRSLEYCQQALEISQSIGDRENEAYSLTGLALNYERLNQLQLAIQNYHQALAIHHEIGATTLVVFDQAGLARIALALNNLDAVRKHTEKITEWIVAGKAQQFWSIYLSAYRLLIALDETKTAHEILTEAYTVLQQRASEISDQRLRQSFLEKVKTNREIIKAWQFECGR